LSTIFLHESEHFKDLIDITAGAMSIKDPALVEKDYWIMHVLWGLQNLNLNFHLKGGTSLSKGYGCIHRFSEDIDLKIEPNYDLYQLIDRADVQEFIGTPEYEAFKIERFGGDDTKVANSDAFKLSIPEDHILFEKEYSRSESLYFNGRPTLSDILARIAKDLDRL
jgi:predicted nucleotidyltransferase component of viral defense system